MTPTSPTPPATPPPHASGTTPSPAMALAELRAFLASTHPGRLPYAIEEVTGQGVRVRLAVDHTDARPGGTVSGPSLMTLADLAAFLAIVGQIGPVALAVTTSLHIDFLRKPALEDVVAVATLLKLGTRLAVVDVALHSARDDSLVAKAQVTYSIPPR